MTFDKAAFGRAVATRRRALGYPQTAVPSGPSSSYLSDIEHGKMDPISAETTEKLALGLRWNLTLLRSVLSGQEPIESLPISAEEDTANAGEIESARIFREAREAQASFEATVDNLLMAEAALDRANTTVLRLLLTEGRLREGFDDLLAAVTSLTATEVALAGVNHATHEAHEWTRYEMALIERFDPEYLSTAGDLSQYSRYMDMTTARKRVSRIPLPDDGQAGGSIARLPTPPGGPSNLSEADESMDEAALETEPGLDESPGGSDSNE